VGTLLTLHRTGFHVLGLGEESALLIHWAFLVGNSGYPLRMKEAEVSALWDGWSMA